MDDFKFLEPTVWVKYVAGAPINLDLNFRYLFNQYFWLGVGGSSNKTLFGEAGFQFEDFIQSGSLMKIGYGFGYPFSDFGPSFGFTHEVNVSMAFE